MIKCLRREILLAFDAVRLDGGLTLRQGRSIDDHEEVECNISTAPATDTHWRDVPSDELYDLCDAMVFLDGKGLRFYLPAMMQEVLSYYDDDTTSSHLPEQLMYILGSKSVFDRVNALLTRRQRRVVVTFLALHLLAGDVQSDVFIKVSAAKAIVQWAQVYGEESEQRPA